MSKGNRNKHSAYDYVVVVVRSGIVNDVRFFSSNEDSIRNAKSEEDYNPDTDTIVVAKRNEGVIWCREGG